MTKKVFFLMFLLSFAVIPFSFSAIDEEVKKEILLRIPLLSQKNAGIISNALSSLSGIKEIEACYELRVLIITYDAEKISDEAVIMNIINQQSINTEAEKIYSSDISTIKKNYKISILKSIGNKTD